MDAEDDEEKRNPEGQRNQGDDEDLNERIVGNRDPHANGGRGGHGESNRGVREETHSAFPQEVDPIAERRSLWRHPIHEAEMVARAVGPRF